MRRPLSFLAAAGVLLAGCSYDFQNPAEKLDSGEVAGRIVADSGNGLEGLGGVVVRLRNSSADFAVEQTTRANGRFILLGLQPGRHSILFEKTNPMTAAVDWAATRDVEIAWGADGQPEGLLIGDVQVRYPVTVAGTLTVPTTGTFYPTGLYAFDDETGTTGTFPSPPDLSGLTQTSTFSYAFPGLAAGSHRLRFAAVGQEWDPYFMVFVPTTYVIGPILKEVTADQAGQTVPLTLLTLSSSAGTGKLRFKVVTPPTLTSAYTVAVTITNQATAAVATCSPYSDGTYECDVDAGPWSVAVVTTPADFTFYDPPAVLGIVTPGVTTELGSIYVTDYSTASSSATACMSGADCSAGMACRDGQCTWDLPACYAGDFTVECSNWSATCYTTGGSTTPCNGGKGVCAYGPAGDTCVPNGASACIGMEPYPIQAPICGVP